MHRDANKSYLALVVQTLDSAIQWISIRETNNNYCTIQWIEIYVVDSAIQHLSNQGQALNAKNNSQNRISYLVTERHDQNATNPH